jgi:hypothetical protein
MWHWQAGTGQPGAGTQGKLEPLAALRLTESALSQVFVLCVLFQVIIEVTQWLSWQGDAPLCIIKMELRRVLLRARARFRVAGEP